MNREQQRRRIDRLRYSIIGGAATGALGIAGALGLAHSAAASSPDTGTGTSPGTSPGTTSTGTTGGTTGDSDDWGGGTELSQGSGASHATTMGS